MEPNSNTRSIIFIHGMFVNSLMWEGWMNYFINKRFTCYAPDYPSHHGTPGNLRREFDPVLGKLTLNDVIKSIDKLIDSLPDKPILVGHGMGGLIVQKLLKMDRAVAGICINSAPPQDINSIKWSYIRSNLAVVNPFKGNDVFIPSLAWFHYAFCNIIPVPEAKLIYDKLVVPESRNILRSSYKNIGRINFKRPHSPLLFIASEHDNLYPASLVKKNFKAYKDATSTRAFKLFPGRSHLISGHNNWDFMASHVIEWIDSLNE